MVIRRVLGLVSVPFFVLPLLVTGVANAQVGDHLRCYKVTDPLDLKGRVDLSTLEYGQELGCRLGEAEMYCVPATKTVVELRDGRDEIEPQPVHGDEDDQHRVCYKILCPDKLDVNREVVTDQFGSRNLAIRPPGMLCTPAYRGPLLSTTSTTTTTLTSTTSTTRTTTTTSTTGTTTTTATTTTTLQPVECVEASDCEEDGNVCTESVCVDGQCETQNTDARPCEDGDACTLADVCVNGACTGLPKDCDDGNDCTIDDCDDASGECLNAPVGSTVPCDDGDACTAADVCIGTTCRGRAVNCDDSNGCTDDSCDPETGRCSHSPVDEALDCDDANACTNDDTCVGSLCIGTPVLCEDESDCTVDSCDVSSGACVFAPVEDGSPCDDGSACTVDDHCELGVCGAHEFLLCDDEQECTVDSCDETLGCVNEPSPPGEPCSVGVCSGQGQCVRLSLATMETTEAIDARSSEGTNGRQGKGQAGGKNGR